MHPAEKIFSLKKLSSICMDKKVHREKICLTSGCFDLLHGGHLEYIYEACKFGFLVVGINSDKFVKKLKGSGRPIRTEDDRALTMAGFYSVGAVVIFDCDYSLIENVQPDYYVASKTSNVRIYEDKKRVVLLNKSGAEIIELGHFKQDSTTDIIKRASKLS
jgi:D-beta-D-heptose 7-phosphate kinase/D-beta-D-heptose 1-phosphate adenosyltransferase